MPIPEQYRKQLEQQRQMAEVRSQLDKQYTKEMSKVALNDMPSFSEWMDKRQQPKGMADGGLTWKSPDWKPHEENDLLQPIGASRMVGDEKLMSQDDTFSHGLSEFPSSKKSYRYLYHGEDKKPIGSMQIQTSGPRSKKAVIQNLYVAEDNRREGIASKLLKRARQDFDVKHSTDLTTAGKAFAKAVKAKGGAVKPTMSQMLQALAKGGSVVKEPKSTVKAYKLFRVHPDHPGKLFPLFVDANTPVEMNKWVDAKEGDMKDGKVKSKIGALAYRPGWHAGDLPIATHIGEKSDPKLTAPDRRPANHAWAEVEMPNDVDWQSEATKRGTNAQGKVVPVKAHITDQIPKGGHYRYKTNPNMTGNWLIGGSMKVNKVLTDKEVERINSNAGMSDLPRSEPFKKKSFGFAKGGCVAPDEWMAEEHINHKAEGGKVEPTQDEMRLALSKRMRHGMYSPLERLAVDIPRNKGTGAEFMAEISKRPGFKQEEVADRKIPVPEGKMTKADFLAHLQKHSLPKLEEKVYDESQMRDEEDIREEVSQELYGLPYDEIGNTREQRRVSDEVYRIMDKENGPRYGDYQLPGGKNYREMLLKLPETFGRKEFERLLTLQADQRRSELRPEQLAELAELKDKQNNKPSYQSSHWKEDPNVLAHMRLSDRTGPSGEKLLHLEELQSDWHQKGRKEGYENPEEKDYIVGKLRRGEDLTPEEDEIRRSYLRGKVPDAPFKKSWHEMALKHALHHAAKRGYHGLVITPGQEQAKRYDLSKHINDLQYDPQTKTLSAWDHSGNKVVDKNDVNEDQLSDYIGKEGASKLLAKNPGDTQVKQLFGADLQVGGEGMKGFYDKIVPDYLNKFGKPHGVKVGSMSLETKPAKSTPQIAAPGVGYFPEPTVEPAETKQVHHFPITEPMREKILKEGMPQYMRGGIIHKAEGGNVQPSIAQMKMQLAQKGSNVDLQRIGVNEAPNMTPKHFFPPATSDIGMPSPGGVATPSGMPIGGIDMSKMQGGQQLMPQLTPPQPPQGAQPPQGGQPPQPPQGQPPMGAQQGGGNILQMTPQGQTMAALGGGQPPKPPGMAKGGSMSTEDMKAELAKSDTSKDKRVTISAEGSGGVKGIVVPRHTLEGNAKVGAVGLHEMNEARAKVYGDEHREPLTLNKIAQQHKKTLAEHFAKPLDEQHEAEADALKRLRDAKHLGSNANTLDESEKLDTVRHEHDEQGRTHVGFASKGVAGHALYTSGHGKDTKYHVINTCPGQTEGCGGGKDSKGIVDTKKGTCFAPNAESQYAGAAVRRAAHEQAKHDPKMTNDWILAHTGSLRNAARMADKNNQRLLFRPNVVDETDVSSRHAIRHLNEQRRTENKPDIIANSYGKTNELHDPENGYYVTHSNVGPKVKKGQEIAENVGRDKARVRNTIMAADNKGDFTNEQGNKTPPKGSYMVTDVKRGSPMAKKMEEHITHAKYWTTGRPESELTHEEREEGPEGHFGGTGRKTSEDKAHYGHITNEGLRYDYQKQHILHPRLVQVGQNKDGTKHMIPTDSRFKDTEFLPKNRFKTKNGKEAGHILMTTPTESTSNIGHQTSFTHNVSDKHIEHAQKNNGEYEIDRPQDQAKAKGKEYTAPQAIKFYAEGGQVGGRHVGFSHDDFHAFPEQNVVAQRHLAMRKGDEEDRMAYHSGSKKHIAVHKNMDTMRLELTRKK